MNRYPIIVLVLFAAILITGCVQQSPSINNEITDTEVIVTTPVPVVEDEPDIQLEEPVQVSEPDTPVPVMTPMEEKTVPTPVSDPNLAFRDLVHGKLDLIQEGKEAVLSAWEAEDPVLTASLVEDLHHLIRNNNDASTFPKKMDYVRVNYYDFIDRMIQFTDNFGQAASLMEKGEESSANSYVAAGIMAGDRADISDKRIRVFLRDHPVLL
ncbi:hypothetical protein [Methanospirillum sp.]|uniref:hypothetical protein n=1 Tax=Methanospirillum sp. TaxID=45200 RepID=UPI0029877087|nr:hypothetical protein [Methanospirillum sp.]